MEGSKLADRLIRESRIYYKIKLPSSFLLSIKTKDSFVLVISISTKLIRP